MRGGQGASASHAPLLAAPACASLRRKCSCVPAHRVSTRRNAPAACVRPACRGGSTSQAVTSRRGPVGDPRVQRARRVQEREPDAAARTLARAACATKRGALQGAGVLHARIPHASVRRQYCAAATRAPRVRTSRALGRASCAVRRGEQRCQAVRTWRLVRYNNATQPPPFSSTPRRQCTRRERRATATHRISRRLAPPGASALGPARKTRRSKRRCAAQGPGAPPRHRGYDGGTNSNARKDEVHASIVRSIALA